jgi:hypothetical protein
VTEASLSSESLAPIYGTARPYILEDRNHHTSFFISTNLLRLYRDIIAFHSENPMNTNTYCGRVLKRKSKVVLTRN